MTKEEFIMKCRNSIDLYSLRMSIDTEYFTMKEIKACAQAINSLSIMVEHLLREDEFCSTEEKDAHYISVYNRDYLDYTEKADRAVLDVYHRVLGI